MQFDPAATPEGRLLGIVDFVRYCLSQAQSPVIGEKPHAEFALVIRVGEKAQAVAGIPVEPFLADIQSVLALNATGGPLVIVPDGPLPDVELIPRS